MDSLYEIDSALFELLERGFNRDCINEETGEIDSEKAQAFLEEIKEKRADKIEGIALYIKDLRAQEKSIKEEEAKLKARRDSKSKKADVLESYLTSSLLAFGETKFETARCVLSIRKSEAVKIENEDVAPIESLIPKEYVKTKITYAADKTALKQALKMGEIIDGVRIVVNQNLQIK